jgi:hypothetical protein
MLEAQTLPIISEAGSGNTKESKPSSDPWKVSAAVDQPRIHRGLCVNCDVRETCTFSKPEGGVWFCEEYQ